VIERTIDKHGVRLLVPDIEIEGWWTSLGECECSDERIIALYCKRCSSPTFRRSSGRGLMSADERSF
jgi:hypothetical protein